MNTTDHRSPRGALTALLLTFALNIGFANGPESPVMRDKLDAQNAAIYTDMQHISMYRTSIRFLKEKKRHDRKTKNYPMVAQDKREIAKAKAEFHKEKHYLRSDKRELKKTYRLAIRERRHALAGDRKRLAGPLRHDPMHSNFKSELMADREALKKLRLEKNEHLLTINRDIRRMNAESMLVNYAEGSMAGLGYRIWK